MVPEGTKAITNEKEQKEKGWEKGKGWEQKGRGQKENNASKLQIFPELLILTYKYGISSFIEWVSDYL